MEDLLNYCGKNPRKLAAPRQELEDGFVSDAPAGYKYRIDTAKIHLTIPKECSAEELMEFALKVMAMAKQMEVGTVLSQVQYGGDEPPGEIQEIDSGIVPQPGRPILKLKKPEAA